MKQAMAKHLALFASLGRFGLSEHILPVFSHSLAKSWIGPVWGYPADGLNLVESTIRP